MLLYWIWFAQLAGVPEWIKLALLDAFRDPEEIYYSKPETLCRVEGIEPEHLQALEDKDLRPAEEILKKCNSKGIKILTWDDSKYPRQLKNISDPPVVLYYRGVLPGWEEMPTIGVVGTRKASGYGLQVAHQMGSQIADCGGLVVSGCASGVDTKALEGALEMDMPTVGVLGCGVDVIYPRTNRRLYSKIQERGCLLSEYPPAEPPIGWHFLRRNRIISGISNGVLVVEAPQRSGALNTARHAREQGRDLFAVPANLGVANFEGSNALLEEGAIAALSGWSVVRHYRNLYPDAVKEPGEIPMGNVERRVQKVAQQPVVPEKLPKNIIDNGENTIYYRKPDEKNLTLTGEETAVLSLLDRTPQHPDQVAARADMPPARVQSILTILAVKGLVLFHSGGRVSIK